MVVVFLPFSRLLTSFHRVVVATTRSHRREAVHRPPAQEDAMTPITDDNCHIDITTANNLITEWGLIAASIAR